MECLQAIAANPALSLAAATLNLAAPATTLGTQAMLEQAVCPQEAGLGGRSAFSSRLVAADLKDMHVCIVLLPV